MQIFNRVVLSESEPTNVQDLWIRDAIEKLPNSRGETDETGFFKHRKSLWRFSARGWEKLFDFDTKYLVSNKYNSATTNNAISTTEHYDPKKGITDIINEFFIYDASRSLGNNKNFVNETGLKYHVDDLQRQINSLNSRMSQAETDIANLRNTVSTLQAQYNNLNSRLSNLENPDE